MPIFLAGCVTGCGALLILAGAGKVFRGGRRMAGPVAVWRALRIPKRLTRPAELTAGGVECATGVLVCARIYPVAGGVALAVLGAGFGGLLGYLRVNRVAGDCGCLGWRRTAKATAKTVTGRAMIRAALLCAAGIAEVMAPTAGAGVYRHASCWAGVLTAGVVLVLLSTRAAVRTPVCHRPIWRPAHASLRALTGHEVFAAMASAAGPLGPEVSHRRAGCADEFWFPVAGGDDGKAVVFRVDSTGPDGSLTVHAMVRAGLPNHDT